MRNIFILKSVFVCLLVVFHTEVMAVNYHNNHYPLLQKPYMELPIGSIQPSDWIGKKLKLMCSGMTEQIDSIYPEVVCPRNRWFGSDGDVWERALLDRWFFNTGIDQERCKVES